MLSKVVNERTHIEGEPGAKRQHLATLSPLDLLALSEAPAEESEGPSTPVDPEISRFSDSESARGPSEYLAEARMRGVGLNAFCDALAFTGLRDELVRFSGGGVTILAPTDEAFARLPEEVRTDVRLVRALLLGHMCVGTSTVDALKDKECAVAVAGQTHAVYDEDGHVCVGTACFSRNDISFTGGVIHELSSVLMILWLVRDAHTEQVWKKSLQPSPVVSTLGGLLLTGNEYEVHGCLLHAATGSLIPDGLRGHVRSVKATDGEQRLAFTEVTVLTKPPSLAKRRGVDAEIGNNRYRLLFSVWNTATQQYVTWQHMATPLVVRNSFHMLPIEEKNYRRTQYARSRGRPTPLKDEAGGSGDSGRLSDDNDDALLTEGQPSQAAAPMPALPRLAFEAKPVAAANSDGPGEEFDFSAASALCAMAHGMGEA